MIEPIAERRVHVVSTPVIDEEPESPTVGKTLGWLRFMTLSEERAKAEAAARSDRLLQSFTRAECERLPVKQRLQALAVIDGV